MHISPHYTLHMDNATDAWGQGTAPQSAGPTISPITLIQHPPSTTRCNATREHSFNLLNHFEDPEAGPSASPPWCPALSVSYISKGMQSGLVLGWPRNLSFFEKLALLHYFGIAHGLTQECQWHFAVGKGIIKHSLVDRFRNCFVFM